jgi:hypothetical protein
MFEIDELKRLSKIIEKTEQTIRIYNKLYAEREDLYKALFKKRIFRKAMSEEERKAIIKRLRTINEREITVFEIIKAPAIEMYNGLQRVEKLKESQASLYLIHRYFTEVMDKQQRFLMEEKRFLNNEISPKEFKAYAQAYLSELEKFSNEMANEYSKFYSPKDFEAFIKQHKGILGNKYFDMLGFTSIFVGQFVLIHNFNHAVPKQFINPNSMPDLATFLEFIFICSTLSVFSIPNKTWGMIKKSLQKVVDYF